MAFIAALGLLMVGICPAVTYWATADGQLGGHTAVQKDRDGCWCLVYRFHSVWTSSPRDGAVCIQALESPPQTYPGVCLLGDSKFSQ